MNKQASVQKSHLESREILARPPEVYDVWLDEKSPGSPWFDVK